jgi:hypothetical protein
MKLYRRRLLILAAAAGLAVLAALLAGNPRVQTWWVRRALARRPQLHGSVGRVAIGLGATEIRSVHLERNGAVLDLPLVEAELPALAAIAGRELPFHRLTAKGWTLDLSGVAAPAAGPAGLVTAAVFRGVFEDLRLPVDLALDGVELDGDIVLPPAPGQAPLRMHVSLAGGGLEAGQEGRFTFAARSAPLANAPVRSVAFDGIATAAMDTPRTFTRLAVSVTAAATLPKPGGAVKLAAELGAVRQSGGEVYTATLVGQSKQLAAITGNFPADTRRLAGTWKVDLSDDDLSPFALGRVLPVFAAAGQGRFDTDAEGLDAHVSGDLNAVLDRLAGARSALTALGSLRLAADFDITRRRSLLRVDRLDATVSRAGPILTVRSLQSFAFDVGTGELQVADATRNLLGIRLQGLPLAWLAPWTLGLDLGGDPLRGDLVASAGRGGLTLSTPAPLESAGLEVDRAGRPLLRGAALALSLAAEYTPQGWQVEVAPAALTAAGANLASLTAKIGRLAGANEPIKVTGRLTGDLPGLLAQPAFAFLAGPGQAPDSAGPQPVLTRGQLAADFSGSLGAGLAVQAKISCTGLAADRRLTEQPLPDFGAELRADVSPEGRVSFNLPLTFARDGRTSDLTLAGTLRLTLAGLRAEGDATSEHLALGDLLLLGAPWAGPSGGGTASGPVPPPAGFLPHWRGLQGQFRLALKAVDFGDGETAANVTGFIAVDPRSLTFERIAGGLADGGRLSLSGKLGFAPGGPAPWSLAADVTLDDFDPAGLCRRINPNLPPSVEGKFDLTAHLAGQGANPGEAAARAQGQCEMSSKGGIFRALATEISPRSAAGGKGAVIGALLGDVASAVGDVLSRHKADNGFSNPALAIAEVAKDLSVIHYDQLSLKLSRDATLDTVLKDLALISPDLRLQGGGKVAAQADKPLFDQPLALELKLGARGRLADALKYAGLLAAQPDDLGYKPCLLPLEVGGTLARPDTSGLQAALLKLAYDRSGAADLLNQLRGK